MINTTNVHWSTLLACLRAIQSVKLKAIVLYHISEKLPRKYPIRIPSMKSAMLVRQHERFFAVITCSLG